MSYPSAAPAAPARWVAPVALLIALIAAVAAGWALLKPAPQAASAPTPAGAPTEAADPKADACQAFYLVSSGVALQTKTDIGPEPAALQAVAANARLAMASGAVYLRDRLPANTPPELDTTMRSFADQLQTIAQYYLAGQKNNDPEQAARLTAVEKTTQELIAACK